MTITMKSLLICIVLLCIRLLAVHDAATTRVAGSSGGRWVEDCRHFMRQVHLVGTLTPFELGRAPSPPERLRGGAARAGRGGCCWWPSWKAGPACSERWTPPCLWASQELWSWSSDRSGDNEGRALVRRRRVFGVLRTSRYQITQPDWNMQPGHWIFYFNCP